MGDSWYGLTFELNLGSAGALAGSAGLVVSILAAWNPEEEGLYVGLKLPGSSGGKKEIVIQGLLKITFKSIEFVVYPMNANQVPFGRCRLIRKSRWDICSKSRTLFSSFWCFLFRRVGRRNLFLFGDPRDVQRKDKLLGWYAAYAKK